MSVSSMTRLNISLAATALLALSFGQGAAAQDHPAQTLVVDAVSEAIEVLEVEADALSNDPELLSRRVEELIVPHVDFNTMTKLAVGKHWRRADAGQKTELVSEFKDLLMNTYAGALSEYKGQTITFLPFRPERRDDRAVVRSQFNQGGGSGAVPVIYKLREKDGWSIYDIEVNDLSLVTSYRSAFSNEISKGGIEGLIGTMKQRNAGKS
jgi:phospholipid transport system substrate-binding protein